MKGERKREKKRDKKKRENKTKEEKERTNEKKKRQNNEKGRQTDRNNKQIGSVMKRQILLSGGCKRRLLEVPHHERHSWGRPYHLCRGGRHLRKPTPGWSRTIGWRSAVPIPGKSPSQSARGDA